MKKLLAVYTPINPTRPWVGRLRKLHERNVQQNDSSLFDYFSEEVLLPPRLQKEGLFRGQNVIKHFNQFYMRVKNDYEFICKWDDDIILKRDILAFAVSFFDRDPDLIGVGLFQEDYGKPFVLLEDPLELKGDKPRGWYGAFSRFYMYRMDVWDVIEIKDKSGDPDNNFQLHLKGNKHILDVPSIHLDHRALAGNNEAYRVLIDFAAFFMAL